MSEGIICNDEGCLYTVFERELYDDQGIISDTTIIATLWERALWWPGYN